ncbi:hypothetical protein C8R46DRAFT_1064093 [Mycena filopes]|nr:hypothetical protein C8R46DRAFT_1064093 [Mycena filopes]
MPPLESVTDDDNGRAAFEAWADATLERATATATAADAPVVVDLSALVNLRGPTAPPTAAPASATTTTVGAGSAAPRELSEEERRRDWQRGAGRSERERESWPSFGYYGPRTIERVTAQPALEGESASTTLEDALRVRYGHNRSGGREVRISAGAGVGVGGGGEPQPVVVDVRVTQDVEGEDKEDAEGTPRPRPRTRTFFERIWAEMGWLDLGLEYLVQVVAYLVYFIANQGPAIRWPILSSSNLLNWL